MRTALVFFLVSGFALTGFGQSKSDEEVWARVDAINKAIFEVKDSVALADLVAEGVTYGHSTGLIEDKPTMIHGVMINPEVYKNLTFEKISIGHAGETVICRYFLRAEVDKNGVASQLNLGVMQVWAKYKGKWRLFARQAVKVTPK